MEPLVEGQPYKKICSHIFKANDREIAVYLTNHDDDCIVLEFSGQTRDEAGAEIHMRPDEAMLTVKLLSEALWKSIKGYDIELLEEEGDKDG